MAVGTGLFLTHNAPATDAELMELVSTGEPEGVLQHPVLVRSHQQLVCAHSTDVSFQMTFWDSFLFVVADVCRHLLRANLSKVPRNDTVVERVEHAEEAGVHPGGGLHIEDQVEPKEGCHHGQVAKDAIYIPFLEWSHLSAFLCTFW